MGLSAKGRKVHLTTTDPAAHLKFVIDESSGITMSRIDEHAELEKYKEEVLSKARETMSDEDIAYVEEDLRSPCTQEIAVFRAFAEIVDKAEDQVVVIDTAPTGHTLLLLESTQATIRKSNAHRAIFRNLRRNYCQDFAIRMKLRLSLLRLLKQLRFMKQCGLKTI